MFIANQFIDAEPELLWSMHKPILSSRGKKDCYQILPPIASPKNKLTSVPVDHVRQMLMLPLRGDARIAYQSLNAYSLHWFERNINGDKTLKAAPFWHAWLDVFLQQVDCSVLAREDFLPDELFEIMQKSISYEATKNIVSRIYFEKYYERKGLFTVGRKFSVHAEVGLEGGLLFTPCNQSSKTLEKHQFYLTKLEALCEHLRTSLTMKKPLNCNDFSRLVLTWTIGGSVTLDSAYFRAFLLILDVAFIKFYHDLFHALDNDFLYQWQALWREQNSYVSFLDHLLNLKKIYLYKMSKPNYSPYNCLELWHLDQLAKLASDLTMPA